MLWPVVLPAQITFWALSGLLLLATATAPLFGQKRKLVLAWGVLLVVLAFMPSCAAVMSVLDHYRFGVFTYPDFQSVNDFRVQRYLPEPATDITVNKYATGYRAKFKIKKQALDDWFDRVWEQYGEYSAVPRASSEESELSHPDEFGLHFGDLGWPPLPDAVKYEGPVAGNGAGFTIWYSESEGIACQRVGYW